MNVGGSGKTLHCTTDSAPDSKKSYINGEKRPWFSYKENPQNSEPQNGPRRGLDFIL